MKELLALAAITAGLTLTTSARADFPQLQDLESKAASATSGDSAQGSQSMVKSLSDKAVVHLNSASASDLTKLPGIGPEQAQAIINARPFNSVQDLSKVKGLKEAAVSKLKGMVAL